MREKYAVITGASSGIGREFAKQLSTKGYSLILVARRKEYLIELKNELNCYCEIIVADLSLEEECYHLYEIIQNKNIELLINNAGFGDFGLFVNGDLQKEMNMIDVNIKAVQILTKLVLQDMYKKNAGSILNIASFAGLVPAGPYMSTYYASKAYVTSLTQAIAQELKEHHSDVYIGCLCPGPVDTEFHHVANVEFALKGISAITCVNYALKMMKRRKTVIVPSIQMKLAMTFGRFLPRRLYIEIISHQQKKKTNIKRR